MEDERFKHVSSDAKFRRIPKREQKIKIDNRFQSMFKDKKFKEEYTVDQRGRPIKHSSTQNLKRYYHLSSSDESSTERDEDNSSIDLDPVGRNELKKVYTEDKKVSSIVKKKLKNLKVNYARGEETLFSESSSDEVESEDELSKEEENFEHKWGELDAEADRTEKITHRLAVCNMDWDRIRAVDILVLLNSFLPTGGTIQNVKIYLSDFGKKRLAEEDISGPTELRESRLEEENEETEEGSKYHMEKLRQYQLNRLKYYYAVVTFSDPNTANKVYMECDGMEYESSATKMDLRFIPDDLEFDEEHKEICDKMPEMNKYQPRFFITTALQQAKVNLTWDETNPDRTELTQKLNSGKIEDIEEAVLQNYLALSSENESADESTMLDKAECDNPVEKYKALLQDIEEKEKEKQSKEIQMEITWGLELEKKSQELVKKKLAEKVEKTPFQLYLDKRKEKRKEKKELKKQGNENISENENSDIPSDVDMNDPYFAEEFDTPDFIRRGKKKKIIEKSRQNELDEQKQAELELLLMNGDTTERKHFNLKTIIEQDGSNKSKKKVITELNDDNFEVDVSDARFSAIFSSHHYSIDPSDPHYKKTKGMEKLISEKLKRRVEGEEAISTKRNKMEKQQKKNIELSVLVKSVKRKTEAMNKNK